MHKKPKKNDNILRKVSHQEYKMSKKKLLKTFISAGSVTALIGPAVTILQTSENQKVDDNVTVEEVKDNETVAVTLEQNERIDATDIPIVIGGWMNIAAQLGIAHDSFSGRGWSNMFWGNQWNFDWNPTSAQKEYKDGLIGNQHPLSDPNLVKDGIFTYSDYRSADTRTGNRHAYVLNDGSFNSTLDYDNYETDVLYNYNSDDGGVPTMTSKLQSSFKLGSNPNLQDDVSSSFLLLLYSMFITGEGSKLTGDPTWDTSPETLFLSPVLQLRRSNPPSGYNDLSIAAAIGSAAVGAIIGGVSGGPMGAIAAAAGLGLTMLFTPQLNGMGIAGVKTSLEQPEYISIKGSKDFMWWESVKLKNKYFEDDSYNIEKFFITDITLTSTFNAKLSYNGINGWKPWASITEPGISFSYMAEGTRVVTTATTYDYSQWLIEDRKI